MVEARDKWNRIKRLNHARTFARQSLLENIFLLYCECRFYYFFLFSSHSTNSTGILISPQDYASWSGSNSSGYARSSGGYDNSGTTMLEDLSMVLTAITVAAVAGALQRSGWHHGNFEGGEILYILSLSHSTHSTHSIHPTHSTRSLFTRLVAFRNSIALLFDYLIKLTF